VRLLLRKKENELKIELLRTSQVFANVLRKLPG